TLVVKIFNFYTHRISICVQHNLSKICFNFKLQEVKSKNFPIVFEKSRKTKKNYSKMNHCKYLKLSRNVYISVIYKKQDIRKGRKYVTQRIWQMFTKVWITEELPEDWKTSLI
ncbi:Uncharacterized protein FWK35_00003662, partial [Aphis craccivora]